LIQYRLIDVVVLTVALGVSVTSALVVVVVNVVVMLSEGLSVL